MLSEGLSKIYDQAFLGGTFDRFHAGHKSLIDTALHIARKVFVGIVSDDLGHQLFPRKRHHNMIQKFKERSENVRALYKNEMRLEIEALYDLWGPAPIADIKSGVLVTSRETKESGAIINEIRRNNNLIPLDVVVIPWIKEGVSILSSSSKRDYEYQLSMK